MIRKDRMYGFALCLFGAAIAQADDDARSRPAALSAPLELAHVTDNEADAIAIATHVSRRDSFQAKVAAQLLRRR